MMNLDEMKALRRDVGSEEFEYRIGLHCKELFELNSNGFFDGFEFIKSELFEDVVVDGDMRDVIVYRCFGYDGYDYCITVSFDGRVMFGRKITNIFKGARFGDKFVTENGDVLIYGRRMDTGESTEYGKLTMDAHIMMGDDGMYYVYESGEFVGAGGCSRHSYIVGRLSDDDLDVVKVYVKKELGDKDDDGYMQGFVDGYNNCIIG